MGSFLVVATASIFAFALSVRAAGIEEDGAKLPLKVLVVSSDVEHKYAAGIKRLLEQHNVAVTVLDWQSATVERSHEFDLIIVTGSERRVRAGSVILDYDKPILGYGCYGCGYFGLLRLKNGQPYT